MKSPDWPMPETTVKHDGSPRQVGVEMEFQGIAVKELAQLIATTLRGDIETVSIVEYAVHVPDQGDYRVELDFARLKALAKETHDAEDEVDNTDTLDVLALDAIGAASSLVVPCEVVAPPLPMATFAGPMQRLTTAIRDAGGKGTGYAFYYAFGLHLNVEPPDLEADTVVAYMKAFACLFDWIVWQGNVDWARRATPYIQRYPAGYDMKLTDPDYWPDWPALVDDYLKANPTRNRALDMLPLFSQIDAEQVRSRVDDDRVQARPTFHYRLANCAIDEPDWSVADPWRRWLQIEHLASDREKLTACCAAYRRDRDRLLHRFDNAWRERVTPWLRTF